MFPAGLRLAAFVVFSRLRPLLLRHSTGAARERRRTLLRRRVLHRKHLAAPRVAPQVHRPPQMAAPRPALVHTLVPLSARHRPPSPGRRRRRRKPSQVDRNHSGTSPSTGSPRAQRRLAAPPDRGLSAAREAACPGPRDNLARQQPQGPQTVAAAERAGRAPRLLSKPSQTYSPAGRRPPSTRWRARREAPDHSPGTPTSPPRRTRIGARHLPGQLCGSPRGTFRRSS